MLKIIHTSDWHLGQRFMEKDRTNEHSFFLNWLTEFIRNQEIDALIIAGDVFDSANPPAQALEMYYSFLASLIHSKCKYIIILGGNHDSPSVLNAPREYLKYNNIFVLGSIPENIDKQIIEIRNSQNEKAIIAAVPFLRERDIRKASAGELISEIEKKIKTGIYNHYHELEKKISEKYDAEIPVIATGHLFVAGSKLSNSEKDIHVGNLGAITSDIFAERFNYVALGHIHQAQAFGQEKRIRYSGSPIPLSFSECNQKKSLVLLEIENNRINQQLIDIPQVRTLVRFKGDDFEAVNFLSAIKKPQNELPTWVEITLKLEIEIPGIREKIKENVSPENCEILSTLLELPPTNASQFYEMDTTLREITVDEVFAKLCERKNFDLKKEENKEIYYKFKEILEEI